MTSQPYPPQTQDQTDMPSVQAPVEQEKTNRSLLKFILLGFITFGIYDIVVLTESTNALNRIASKHDGKKTTNYCLVFFLFGWMSFGVAWFIWYHTISNRIGGELQRRGLDRMLSASDYWLWNILGSIIIVGPFIYMYKFMKAMNALCEDYNMKG